LKSYFITGTDTDVGKTWITAGIASALKKMGIDIGIMRYCFSIKKNGH